ncbi:unnamed protein product [Effrenium voratum]|nr:unnamed protein product [Effrenium voratum]
MDAIRRVALVPKSKGRGEDARRREKTCEEARRRRKTPQRLVEETTGKEQAMISAKRLLANLLASRQLSSGVSTAAIEAAERAARAVRKFQPSELTVSANSLASVR